MISVALVQDVPPLDLGEIFAYFLKQSVPLFDQLGIKRGEMLYFICLATPTMFSLV